ncbi:MAG: PqqD family protein [Alistipes sp.]|nr:PqqD family protein [Alistipes sp.]
MKLRSQLKLRKMGSVYMLVDALASEVNLTNVYTLNETAAQIWQHIGDGELDVEQMANYLCEEYEVEYAQTIEDVKALVEEWIKLGLVTE